MPTRPGLIEGDVKMKLTTAWGGALAVALLFTTACATANPDQRAGQGGRPVSSSTGDSASSPTGDLKTNAVSGSGSGPGWAFRYTGAIKSRVVWDNNTLILDVPLQTDLPVVSVADALQTCKTGDSVCGSPDATSHVELGLLTITAAGTPGADGSVVPLVKDKLVYAMQWSGVPCVAAGVLPTAASTATVQQCIYLAFVDAKTGTNVYGVSGTGL